MTAAVGTVSGILFAVGVTSYVTHHQPLFVIILSRALTFLRYEISRVS
jgi:hypothetical protein